MTTDIKELINKSPMTTFQVVAVAICIVLNMLDGFDVLVVAFTAAELSKAWSLNATQVGVLLSAGLIGMSIGSLVIAPLADIWGRRVVVLGSLVFVTAGMLLSALASGLYALAALRVVTGLGIGGMLASLTVITSEYSSDKRRNLCISLYSTGYPIGAVIGGSVAAVLIASYGWRAVYAFGGVVSLLMIPLVVMRLPESLDFLLARRTAATLAKVNDVLQRTGHAQVSELPAVVRESHEQVGIAQLFGPALRTQTLRIWVAFFLHMFCFYFVVSWTPKLLTAAGLSAAQGISGGVILSLGGIAGGIVFGLLSSRFPLHVATAGFMLCAGIMMLGFGLTATSLQTALPMAFVLGFFIYGAMMGLYALTPQLHAPLLRGTGMGFAIGIGRFGGILAPTIAGVLLDAAWKPEQVYLAFAAPMGLAMFTVYALRASTANVAAVSGQPGLEAGSSA